MRHLKLVAFLIRFQRGLCYICGAAMRTDRTRGWTKDPRAATRDHVLPRAQGGTRPDNVLLACRCCNTIKGPTKPRACELLYVAEAHRAYHTSYQVAA